MLTPTSTACGPAEDFDCAMQHAVIHRNSAKLFNLIVDVNALVDIPQRSV
jgi:hypothetical protein